MLRALVLAFSLAFAPAWVSTAQAAGGRSMPSRSAGPAEGTVAPDFTLEIAGTSDTLQLSSLWGDRPVVLVFGSYT